MIEPSLITIYPDADTFADVIVEVYRTITTDYPSLPKETVRERMLQHLWDSIEDSEEV